MKSKVMAAIVAALGLGVLALAQGGGRPASPVGTAATEVGGKYVKGAEGQVYQGGKWIEISYGRPIKRGRNLWGSGATYGKDLNADAPSGARART